MSKKAPVKKPVSPPKPAPPKDQNAFERMEKYLESNQTKLLLLLPLILGALFASLTFDVKISEGNDDAMYIEAATKYAADFTGYYYTANAPMYPMLLGVVTMISGFNLTLYKVLNTIFFLAHLALMYFAFRKRVPYTVLFPVLLFSSVNSYLLYYSSQTYTEMLFLTLQATFFLVFFNWQEKMALDGGEMNNLKSSTNIWSSLYNNIIHPADQQKVIPRLKNLLLVGTALFLMTFCKNIAIGMLGAVIVFFVIQRNWKSLVDAVAGYLIIRLSFEGIKAFIWGASNQYGSQGAILLQKDAYNPAAGQEDISGFISRFFENFKLYNGKRLFQILGFKDPESNEAHGILAFLVLVIIVFTAWRVFVEIRKITHAPKHKLTEDNKLKQAVPYNVLMVLVFVVTELFLIFLVLQIRWDQPRLIMVYVPLLLMAVFYGLYSLLQKSGGLGRVGYIAFITVIVGSSLLTSIKKSAANYPILKKNLAGDRYYGYSPDWENFLRLSEWAADSLPSTAYVASRKAPMSFVYGKGKPFFPVYTVPAVDTLTNLSNADSVLALFRENKVTHVLLGSLRRNPNKADGYIINTLHRMLQPVAQKYPQKVKLVKQIGASEPAYLYEISQ